MPNLTTYKCTSCGAYQLWDDCGTNLVCPFCGNKEVVKGSAAGEDEKEQQFLLDTWLPGLFSSDLTQTPHYVLSVKINDKEARKRLGQLAKKLPSVAGKLKSKVRHSKLKLVYFPYQIVQGTLRMKYSLEFARKDGAGNVFRKDETVLIEYPLRRQVFPLTDESPLKQKDKYSNRRLFELLGSFDPEEGVVQQGAEVLEQTRTSRVTGNDVLSDAIGYAMKGQPAKLAEKYGAVYHIKKCEIDGTDLIAGKVLVPFWIRDEFFFYEFHKINCTAVVNANCGQALLQIPEASKFKDALTANRTAILYLSLQTIIPAVLFVWLGVLCIGDMRARIVMGLILAWVTLPYFSAKGYEKKYVDVQHLLSEVNAG